MVDWVESLANLIPLLTYTEPEEFEDPVSNLVRILLHGEIENSEGVQKMLFEPFRDHVLPAQKLGDLFKEHYSSIIENFEVDRSLLEIFAEFGEEHVPGPIFMAAVDNLEVSAKLKVRLQRILHKYYYRKRVGDYYADTSLSLIHI